MSSLFESEDACENTTGIYRQLSQRIADVRARLKERYERLFPGQSTLIETALEEAESAAWCTPFPQLFLPDFAELRLARITNAA